MEIKDKNKTSLKERSISNLTADVNLTSVRPAKGRILIGIKVWPAQSIGGIFVAESYTVIRNNKYIAEVLEIGEGVTCVKKGHAVTVTAFAGYHVATKTGHAKIVSDTDILSSKENLNMNEINAFAPESFKPGINYLLVKIKNIKENVTDSGIVVSTGVQQSKNDAITRVAEVVAVGDLNDYGKQYAPAPKVGTNAIIDNFVGDRVNDVDTDPGYEYKVIYIFDILGWVKK
jgi:co-chaperonin GroES (HSP10)